MTIEEFNRTGWKMNMTAKYHGDGETYPVLAVDFGEQLVGLKGVEDEICWARCEHVTLNAPNRRSQRPDEGGFAALTGSSIYDR